MHEDNGVGQEKRIKAESRSALDDILREGARRMLQAAVEAEAGDYVAQHSGLCGPQTGHRLVVRNGRQPVLAYPFHPKPEDAQATAPALRR